LTVTSLQPEARLTKELDVGLSNTKLNQDISIKDMERDMRIKLSLAEAEAIKGEK
jgi:hypothetical protein